MIFKQQVKNILLAINLPVTKNIKYDILTRKILAKTLKPNSNCADLGCYKGEILDLILEYAPAGNHYAFEPLPHLYDFLKEKYKALKISLLPVALFDKKGETSFQYVVNAPSYSGIKKRKYATKDADIRELKVNTDLLDNLIPETECIDFIKVDVEGAEYGVFRGGINTLKRCKPVIIFEFGRGAADFYGTGPGDMFALLTGECELKISTLKSFLRKKSPLTGQEFAEYFENGREYYFVAHP
jgi:FkbM family methyltransferase